MAGCVGALPWPTRISFSEHAIAIFMAHQALARNMAMFEDPNRHQLVSASYLRTLETSVEVFEPI